MYIEKILENHTFHNGNVLVCVEIKLSAMTLNAIKPNSNKQSLSTFAAELDKAKKKLVKVSNESKYKDCLKQSVIVDEHCNPQPYLVEEDDLELQNVIEDFKHDSKGSSLNNGILYPCRVYFTFHESRIVSTIK